ncbi:hypothetical protein [Azonexus hydrophilus]|uniref:hypothetical protein n=1 Tax=Azonexus hydrophilus TaxID=418702 RepID=UPI001115A3D5|nr:hypothetical protein [Azonexus hydrophilus]
MRSRLSSISRLLALIMLITVLAPGFGWESAGGMMGQAIAAPAAMDDHSHSADAACDGCGDHAAGECVELHHHCCPGHILGHLPGHVAGALALPLPSAGNPAVDRGDRQFSSRVPDGLERPPRSVSA